MASRYKDKDAGVVLAFNGQWVSWTHTAVAYSTLLLLLHTRLPMPPSLSQASCC